MHYQAKLLDLLQQNPLKAASLISFKKKKTVFASSSVFHNDL